MQTESTTPTLHHKRRVCPELGCHEHPCSPRLWGNAPHLENGGRKPFSSTWHRAWFSMESFHSSLLAAQGASQRREPQSTDGTLPGLSQLVNVELAVTPASETHVHGDERGTTADTEGPDVASASIRAAGRLQGLHSLFAAGEADPQTFGSPHCHMYPPDPPAQFRPCRVSALGGPGGARVWRGGQKPKQACKDRL